MTVRMLPFSRLLWGSEKIMHIKILGITWYVTVPQKWQWLLCLNPWTCCCYDLVILHFHCLRDWQLEGKKLPINLLENNLETGKNAETLTAICSLSSTKGQEQSIFKIRCNVGVLCRWKGAVCLSRETQPTQEGLNCTTEGRARGLWCSYLRRRHWSRTSSTKDIPELGRGARGTPKSWRIAPHILEPCIADCGRDLESLCKKIECLRQPISGQDTQIDAKNHLTWKLFLCQSGRILDDWVVFNSVVYSKVITAQSWERTYAWDKRSEGKLTQFYAYNCISSCMRGPGTI